MIINVCGFGWSGSGAYLDLLREYEEVTFPTNNDWEFNFLWVPDGLFDLEYKLCNKHSRIFDSALAIDRFLGIAKEFEGGIFRYNKVLGVSFFDMCKEYVDRLVQFKLETNSIIHKLHPTTRDRLVKYFNKFLTVLLQNIIMKQIVSKDTFFKLRFNNYKSMCVSYNPDNFDDITKEFVESILSRIRLDKNKILVLNQALPPDQPELFEHFFKEDIKTIIIKRDPRDCFILMNRLKGTSKAVPTNVEDYITFYKKTILQTRKCDKENIITLQFEDLIYNYEDTIKRVESFFNIHEHNLKYRFFKPQQSVNNTNLVEIYPEFKNDVDRIANEISSELYSFDKYNMKRNSNLFF